MIQWLIDNKEWVFSGVGAAVLVGIAGWAAKKALNRRRGKQIQKSGKGSTNIQAGGNIEIGGGVGNVATKKENTQ